MAYCVFDTETTNLDKPFCYNLGYKLMFGNHSLLSREFVVEQIWHNSELFSTAYYAEKRQLYVKGMRAREIIMDKFGYITQQMIRDFKNHNVNAGYAYNSSFDDRVFAFNCDWFKCINPWDNIPIYDIRGYAMNFICNTQEYKDFCEKHKFFTESGNYATTAESVYAFITNNAEFVEAHTALADTEIETVILNECIKRGAKYETNYPCPKTIERKAEQTFIVKEQGSKKELFRCDFVSKRFTNGRNTVTLETVNK